MSLDELARVIENNEGEMLAEWLRLQAASLSAKKIAEAQLRSDSHRFMLAFREALRLGTIDLTRDDRTGIKDLLAELSRQRALQGFTPSETATFVLSLKQAIFKCLNHEMEKDPKHLVENIWLTTELLDRLGLFTMETFQKSREEIINRQRQDLLELSTPVVELWHGVLALPLIGTLDSARTQIVMQNLLEAIVSRSATLAIIDITGVPTVDTLVAQHLLKTVSAARLMGADCLISGIRPQIAQTIIHLGVDLKDVITKATLADAFRLALQKLNLKVCKA